MELHCHNITDDNNETEVEMTKEGNTSKKLNPEALTFQPNRAAAVIASIKPNGIIKDVDIWK